MNLVFTENFLRRVTAIAIQLNHADKPNVSNVAKSAYYRAATILLCTLIEGIVYQLVKKHTSPNNIIEIVKEHKVLYRIPRTIFNTEGEVCLCDNTDKEIGIDDNGVGFGKLNVFLKNKRIILEEEYRMLDSVRKERNKIHLQGISSRDTGYTKAKFNRLSKPLDFLLPKLLPRKTVHKKSRKRK